MRKPKTYTSSLEVGNGNGDMEYEIRYGIDPAEAPTGPTYDCGGTPGCAASVAWAEVWYVSRVGRKVVKEERRPELDELIDEDELLEAAGESEADAWADAQEAKADAERERRMFGEDR